MDEKNFVPAKFKKLGRYKSSSSTNLFKTTFFGNEAKHVKKSEQNPKKSGWVVKKHNRKVSSVLEPVGPVTGGGV